MYAYGYIMTWFQVSLIFPVLSALTGLYVFVIPWFTKWQMCILWTGVTLVKNYEQI